MATGAPIRLQVSGGADLRLADEILCDQRKLTRRRRRARQFQLELVSNTRPRHARPIGAPGALCARLRRKTKPRATFWARRAPPPVVSHFVAKLMGANSGAAASSLPIY